MHESLSDACWSCVSRVNALFDGVYATSPGTGDYSWLTRTSTLSNNHQHDTLASIRLSPRPYLDEQEHSCHHGFDVSNASSVELEAEANTSIVLKKTYATRPTTSVAIAVRTQDTSNERRACQPCPRAQPVRTRACALSASLTNPPAATSNP